MGSNRWVIEIGTPIARSSQEGRQGRATPLKILQSEGALAIASTKGIVPKVLSWFESNFGLKVPTKRSGILDAILASDDEEVSLGGEEASTRIRSSANDTTDDAFSYTDDGNALRFVRAYAGNVIYVEKQESFYVWAGSHWQKDPGRDRAVALMRVLARRMFEAAINIADEAARKLAIEHAKRSQSERAIRAAVNLAKTDDRIRVDAEVLDTNPDLLSVANGTIDLSCKPPGFRKHRPDDYITKVIPIEFDENATCPEFEKAVTATSNDPDVVAFRLCP